jgi:hypothetical protein
MVPIPLALAALRWVLKLLLILSEAALASDWVEDEATTACAEERDRGQVILFPTGLTTPSCRLLKPGQVSCASATLVTFASGGITAGHMLVNGTKQLSIL